MTYHFLALWRYNLRLSFLLTRDRAGGGAESPAVRILMGAKAGAKAEAKTADTINKAVAKSGNSLVMI